jgi:S1-C subfamily serine protease
MNRSVRHSGDLAAVLAGLALLGVLGLLAALAAGAFRTDHTTDLTRTIGVSPGSSSLDAAAIYAAANPGVVDITAHTSTTTPVGPLGLPEKAAATDTGTGLVLDHAGHVLTAGHVVAGASSVSVRLAGGVTRAAKVLGRDTATDVAVLGIDPSGVTLHPLTLGSLAGLRVGDPLAVIGDPFDVQRSLSVGVISGLDRTISAPSGSSIPHAIQTDAAMNPGNSGGPILDARGRVVGIADQIATGGSGTDSSTGVGFAVPIDLVRGELAGLEAGRTPVHAELGVGATDASAGGTPGALVESVQAGGPAAAAGVRTGDLIVALGGRHVDGVNGLIAAVAAERPGERSELDVIRGATHRALTVTMGREPAKAAGG